MKPTREQIEAKEKEIFAGMVDELQKFRDDNPSWYFGLGKEVQDIYESFKTTVQLFGAVRFIDFLSGDDNRDRWECHCCQNECVTMIKKRARPQTKCLYKNSKVTWKKVGAE